MNYTKKSILIFLILVSIFTSIFSEEISVTIKGMDDGRKTNRNKDYKEAVLDAKRKAIEQAGVKITSKSDVKNFKLVEDFVQANAEGVLLPGFTIVDIGYIADGTYQVVLTGKIQTTNGEEEDITSKELRYIMKLYRRKRYNKVKTKLKEIVDNKSTPEQVMVEAMYLRYIWGYVDGSVADKTDYLDRYEAYYPESPYINKMKKKLQYWKDYIPKAGDINTVDLGNGIELEMVYIPAGSFIMGSSSSERDRGNDEGPVHRVGLDAFYIGKYEVTQAQWKAVMGNNPSKIKGDNLPVEQVSWNDCVEFCGKLSQLTGQKYRLPTEAEWEYACRAGKSTPFSIGDGRNLSSNEANFDGNYPYGNASKGKDLERTTDVGSYEPNDWGLYDMHGNVWEWCLDWYDENYYSNSPSKNPEGALSGSFRVVRGGGWYRNGYDCRSATRGNNIPSFRGSSDFGFRLLRSP